MSVGFIDKILSGNTELIREGEAEFQAACHNPSSLVQGLLAIVRDGHEGQQIQGAMMLKLALQRASGDEGTCYDRLQPQERQAVHAALLELLKTKEQKQVLVGVGGAISTIGSKVGAGGWPELLPNLQEAVQSGKRGPACAALTIFPSLVFVVGDNTTAVAELVHSALNKDCPHIKAAAVEAALTYMTNLQQGENEPDQAFQQRRMAFCSLLSPVLNALITALQQGDTDNGSKILQSVVEMVDDGFDMILDGNALEPFANAMFEVASSQLDVDLRIQALEGLVSICEADSVAAKKLPKFVERCTEAMIGYLRRVPEPTQEWENTGGDGEDEDEDEEEHKESEAGASGLDRMALALGGVQMERHASKQLLAMLEPPHKDDWRNRSAAITGIMHLAEGCKKQYARNLGNLTMLVTQYARDEHKMVRHEAARALTQFCIDFSPDFQNTFSQKLFEAAMTLIQDPVARTRSQACNLILNYSQDVEGKLLHAQLEQLAGALFRLLNDGSQPMFVKASALAAVSAIADNQQKRFAGYVPQTMQMLGDILKLPEQEETQHIKGKAIESASVVLACSEQVDPSAAKTLLDYLAECEGRPEEDKRKEYVMPAWCRMAKLTPELFSEGYLKPLLQGAIPVLMDESDMEVVEDLQPDEAEQLESIRLILPDVGERHVVFNTALMQKKEEIIEMLHNMFTSIPKQMLQFSSDIGNAAILLLKTLARKEIREGAAGLCVQIIKAMAKAQAPTDQLQGAAWSLVEPLLAAIKEESEVDAMATELDCLASLLKAAGVQCIATEKLPEAFKTIHECFNESLKRRVKLAERQQKVKHDDDEMEKLKEEDEGEGMLLISATEVVGALVKTHVDFIPVFTNSFLPQISTMLSEDTYGAMGKKLALCVLDDFLEHGKLHALPYFHNIVEALFSYAMTTSDTAQAAVYGIGVSAEYLKAIEGVQGHPGVPKDFFGRALQLITQICHKHGDEEWGAAVCNAVSTVLKLLENHQGQPNVTEEALLPAVCQLLPVGGDDEEARVVHRKVFERYVLQKHPAVVGPNQENMPAVKNLAQQLLEEFMEDEDEARIDSETAGLLKQLLA